MTVTGRELRVRVIERDGGRRCRVTYKEPALSAIRRLLAELDISAGDLDTRDYTDLVLRAGRRISITRLSS